jgi:hypothetical protein
MDPVDSDAPFVCIKVTYKIPAIPNASYNCIFICSEVHQVFLDSELSYN